MANTIDHSMEKNAAFIAKLQECNINYINPFMLCCLFKDIYLNDYKYCPKLNKYRQIDHFWRIGIRSDITTNDIRFIFETNYYAINELQTQYLDDAQNFEVGDENNCVLQRKIKKCTEICIMLSSGVVYKEFIDCCKNGYLN